MRPALAAGALLAGGFALTFLLDPWQHELVSDIPLARSYADIFLDGWWPYRDIDFEYPPLAAPLLTLPGLISVDLQAYRLLFAALSFALAMGLLLSTGRLAKLTGGDERRALIGLALAPVLAGALIRTHFDLAPVLCAAAGLAAIAGPRPRAGFALLGAGGALKLFPLLAVPIAAVWLAGRGSGREALRGVAIASATFGVAVAAAVALSPSGAWRAVDYHLERPVQIESMPATALNAIEFVGGRAPERVKSHRSDGLEHPAAGALETLFLAAMLAALAALALLTRRLTDPRGFVLAALTAIAAFGSLGKVLSPQYMLWLAPLAALAWAWRMHALAACTAAAIATTQLWFPERYFDLVARHEWPVAAVALRNGLLLAVLALAGRELLRMARAPRAAARSSSPARPAPPRPAPR